MTIATVCIFFTDGSTIELPPSRFTKTLWSRASTVTLIGEEVRTFNTDSDTWSDFVDAVQGAGAGWPDYGIRLLYHDGRYEGPLWYAALSESVANHLKSGRGAMCYLNHPDRKKLAYKILSLDDLDDYYETIQRLDAWKPEMKEKTHNKIMIDNLAANLKTAAAADKPTVHAVPPIALFAMGAAMASGEKKYYRYNWRDSGATASEYFDAIQRHLWDWYNGVDHVEDSNGTVQSLGAVMAGCAILLDAAHHGVLKDDRYPKKVESITKDWIVKKDENT